MGLCIYYVITNKRGGVWWVVGVWLVYYNVSQCFSEEITIFYQHAYLQTSTYRYLMDIGRAASQLIGRVLGCKYGSNGSYMDK